MGEVTQERKNFSKEEVNELIEKFEIAPFADRVIITMNVEEKDGELILSDNTLSDIQYVIAAGEMATRFVTPGDKVMLDMRKLTSRQPANHDRHQLVDTIDIDYIFSEHGIFGIISDRTLKAKFKND